MMSSFKLHHSKFYTRHSGEATGLTHCYRCDEILANGNKTVLVMDGNINFRIPVYAEDYNGGRDDDGEYPQGETQLVVMGAFCALKAIAGK